MPGDKNQEKSFVIETDDGKRIYGCLHSPVDSDLGKAIILVHGLTGHMNEHIHLMLGRYLSRKGYAVLRFNQYGDGAGARVFHETTIRMHVSDTRAVIQYAHQLGFKEIILAGHSLGSPVAIGATDTLVDSLILLDPTGPPRERIEVWQTYDPKHQLSYLDWSMRIVLGEQWIKDARTFPDSYEAFARISCPVLIIATELGEQMPFCQRYASIHPAKPEIKIIPKSGHCFTEEAAVERLADSLEQWLAER